jgi:hypothetical protein
VHPSHIMAVSLKATCHGQSSEVYCEIATQKIAPDVPVRKNKFVLKFVSNQIIQKQKIKLKYSLSYPGTVDGPL